MHGEYDQAIAPRIFLAVFHATAVAATGWKRRGHIGELIGSWHRQPADGCFSPQHSFIFCACWLLVSIC